MIGNDGGVIKLFDQEVALSQFPATVSLMA